MYPENLGGPSRRNHSGTSLADPTLVPQATPDAGGCPISATQITTPPTPPIQQRPSTSPVPKTSTPSLPGVRTSLEVQNISPRAIDIILASWRTATIKQYRGFLDKWFRFCREKCSDPLQPPMSVVLDFLASLYDAGLSYSSLNTARCALSTIVQQNGGHTIGAHPLVTRLIKGVYQTRPPNVRYSEIWDVKVVLDYVKTLTPVKKLSLKDLTLKVVMLTALVSAQRCQTLHKLDLDNLNKGKSSYTFTIPALLKQSRTGYKNPSVKLVPYPPNRSLCVVTAMKEYLMRTDSLRGKETNLLISYVKPHQKVTTSTISRWLRTVLARAGIDTNIFKAHSTRAAAVTAAKNNNVPVEEIMKTAGWSRAGTFAKFYNKPIVTEVFSHKVLKC